MKTKNRITFLNRINLLSSSIRTYLPTCVFDLDQGQKKKPYIRYQMFPSSVQKHFSYFIEAIENFIIFSIIIIHYKLLVKYIGTRKLYFQVYSTILYTLISIFCYRRWGGRAGREEKVIVRIL